MSLPSDVRADLLIVCADAPAPSDRASAHSLLARDLAALLNGSDRDSSRDPAPRCFRDVANGAHGGPDAAQWYYTRPTGLCSGTVGRGPLNPPLSPEALALEYEAINADAPPLIDSARTAMGGAAFEALRRRLRGIPVASAGNFQLDWLLSWPTTASVALPVGTWEIQFTGIGWTRNTTPECDVTFSFVLDGGAPFATHSVARPAAPTGQVDIDQPAAFDVSSTVVVAAPAVLTVNNSGAFEERLLGVLRYYEPGDS